jgi:HEAT repeats
MFTPRSWGGAAVLLCVLLFKNCQSHSVSGIDADAEEEPAVSLSSASAMRRSASSEPMAVGSLKPLSASPAVHVFPSSSSKILANEEALSSRSLSPVAQHTLATMGNSLAVSYNLLAVAMPRAPRAVPLSNKPGHVPSLDGPGVCVGKVEKVLREMPGGEEEDSKPLAKQRSVNLNDELTRKKARAGGRREHGDIRRGVLDILLAMAGSEPNKAIQFLDVLLVAAQDKEFRQQALEALGKVAQASPDMFSACLPSLRAAAKEEDENVRLLALKTLGEVEWKHYFGEVEPAPDLPGDMTAILDSACSFWPGEQVKDTHLLVLMPATVDGKPFTLDLLEELIEHPKSGGHRTQYRWYESDVKEQLGAASLAAPYWLLMTRDVLPGSRDKNYRDHKKLVADHARRTGLPYELPKVLEAATVILTHYVRDGEKLYSNDPWTYTRCQELIVDLEEEEGDEYPSVVGGFESSGLYVADDVGSDYGDFRGVAGSRKF